MMSEMMSVPGSRRMWMNYLFVTAARERAERRASDGWLPGVMRDASCVERPLRMGIPYQLHEHVFERGLVHCDRDECRSGLFEQQRDSAAGRVRVRRDNAQA
jgi:hypothetical protein